MTDIDAILARRKRREETVPLCLDPNLLAEYTRLEADVEQLRRSKPDSLSGHPDMAEKEARLDELAAEIAEVTADLTFRAVPHARWDELIIKHPARRDPDKNVVPRDRGSGVNTAEFFAEIIPESCVSPSITAERWRELLADLDDSQYEQIATAVWNLNQRADAVPLSRIVSKTNRRSDGG